MTTTAHHRNPPKTSLTGRKVIGKKSTVKTVEKRTSSLREWSKYIESIDGKWAPLSDLKGI
jgi:hypothetical protein